jgi:hypothetical protein
MIEEWYNYSEFNFSRDQVLWAILHLQELRDGKWPVNHKETGYTEAPLIARQIQAEAGFIKPASIAAEIDWRLERTKIEGKLLIAEVIAESPYLSDESRSALNYISGWKRKKLDYGNWVKQRKYRSKELNSNHKCSII